MPIPPFLGGSEMRGDSAGVDGDGGTWAGALLTYGLT